MLSKPYPVMTSEVSMHGKLPPYLFALLIAAAALVAASLACNLVAPEVDYEATNEVIYLTITAQAEQASVPTRNPLATQRPPGSSTAAPRQTGTPTAVQSATPTPSATPSATPTPPQERSGNGANLVIARCGLAIAVDADAADWLDQPGGIEGVRLDQATFGVVNWTGGDDLSGLARLCWTSEALYLIVEVTDDVLVQNQSGATQYRGDEVELLFDADLIDDFYDTVWNEDDIQFGLSPGNFVDRQPAVVRYEPEFSSSVNVELAVRRPIGTGGSYVLEAAIPWGTLGITPQTDRGYGLCVALSDNDLTDQDVQQSMVSHCTGLKVPDPTTWVTVRLAP
ncbi:MAG: hypothetical protein Kow00124_15060 [Anaerolineae bacterium]